MEIKVCVVLGEDEKRILKGVRAFWGHEVVYYKDGGRAYADGLEVRLGGRITREEVGKMREWLKLHGATWEEWKKAGDEALGRACAVVTSLERIG